MKVCVHKNLMRVQVETKHTKNKSFTLETYPCNISVLKLLFT